ncbi:MAG: Na+/H+ antiporter subunit E [Desulfuromonadales bacterium]|nr:Na+/H+ antiporter subunit E [Desulfuromonadales bacterium]
MTIRPLLISRLLLRFSVQCLLSGLTTARTILHGRQPPAGFARISFAPMSEAGAALLGAMVSLTPGTTMIDIDMRQRTCLLHLLDTRQEQASIEFIRTRLEPDIARLFPERPS